MVTCYNYCDKFQIIYFILDFPSKIYLFIYLSVCLSSLIFLSQCFETWIYVAWTECRLTAQWVWTLNSHSSCLHPSSPRIIICGCVPTKQSSFFLRLDICIHSFSLFSFHVDFQLCLDSSFSHAVVCGRYSVYYVQCPLPRLTFQFSAW